MISEKIKAFFIGVFAGALAFATWLLGKILHDRAAVRKTERDIQAAGSDNSRAQKIADRERECVDRLSEELNDGRRILEEIEKQRIEE